MGRAFEFRKERKMKRWARCQDFCPFEQGHHPAIKEGEALPIQHQRAIEGGFAELLAANMPKDNIERAIKKATDKDTSDYKEVTLKAAPIYRHLRRDGTDNNNRTVASAIAFQTVEVDNSAPQARWNSCSTVCAFSTCRIQALTSTT